MENSLISETYSHSTQLAIFLGVLVFFSSCASVFLILRYTTKWMSDYRIFLLNISITTTLSDFNAIVISRPISLFPVKGLCAIGVFNGFLVDIFGVDRTFIILTIVQLYLTMISISALTLACFHRYISVARTFRPLSSALNSKFTYLVLFTCQFVLPLLESIPLFGIDLRPPKIMAYNEKMHPEIVERSRQHPCFFPSNDPDEEFWQNLSTLPLTLHLLACAVVCFSLLVFCLRKITQSQLENVITKRTKQMHKNLLVGLSIQTFVPNFLYVIMYVLNSTSLKIENNTLSSVMSMVAICIASLHSAFNLCIMFSIPAYRKGLVNDIRYFCPFTKKTRSSSQVITTTSFHPVFSRIMNN
ncbi:hypothetical protein M3Y95_00170100 [Aphelenchoides besseyi]|nr:hypothetical protein M3Y95_00170100 [Aphelenchoides besseyi]